jgi:hypothetical protein
VAEQGVAAGSFRSLILDHESTLPFIASFLSLFPSNFRERRWLEVEVALEAQPERPANTLKLSERGVPQLVAVRPESGAAKPEEEKITVWLAATFQNVEGTSAARIEEFNDGDRIGDVFLRVERGGRIASISLVMSSI